MMSFLANFRSILITSGLLPYIKRVLYKSTILSGNVKPGTLMYTIKSNIEKGIFSETESIHDLPRIHEYWIENHVNKKIMLAGYQSIEDFYFKKIIKLFESADKVFILSVGSGNCDFEFDIAKKITEAGFDNFEIHCMDFNDKMLKRGRRMFKDNGMEKNFKEIFADFNIWISKNKYHCILANMSLHHVVELEHLFENIRNSMYSSSIFLSYDMIGRNGHMRWPESLALVNNYWGNLPNEYRFSIMINKTQDIFENYDCSQSGFEGIRAQDVLFLLNKYFFFEDFIAFGNVVEAFVDRSIGYNFNPNKKFDSEFIDMLHEVDEAGFKNGTLKPTQMLACMRINKVVTNYVEPLSPSFSIREA